MKAKRLTELAVLTCVALTIFIVELQIPNLVPLPGVKLGLANIITVFALYFYRAPEVMMVLMARIMLGAIGGGNIMSLLYSLSGGVLCLAGMIMLKRIISIKYIWFCSVMGAILHNIGQVVVACFIAGWGMIIYLPILLVSGCLAGAFTGACAQVVIHRGKQKESQPIVNVRRSIEGEI